MSNKWLRLLRKLTAAACLAASMAATPTLAANIQTETSDMDFDQCLLLVRRMSGQLGKPTNIVETESMRVVRFPASNGSVLVTCSKLDGKLIVTQSPHKCGRDVVCE